MNRKYIIGIHVLYWFYIINQFLFPLYVGQHKIPGWGEVAYVKEVVVALFLSAITFYAVYFAFPRLIAFRYKIISIIVLLLVVASLLMIRLPMDWFFWKLTGLMPGKEMVFEWIWVWDHLRLTVITAIYAILIRYLIDAFGAQKLRTELITQRQAGELALLRSQINPHFLFNTLNNIYSLVYQKSDEAPGAVMKFSSIMRYVLYEAEASEVPLVKEIEYLKSYIELQQLRYRQAGLVSMTVEGATGEVPIAPMLLIPFVENAFKHGSKARQPAIVIHIEAGHQGVDFFISNDLRKSLQQLEEIASGMSIAHTRRRLELLYPGKFTLTIGETTETYTVRLHLDIKAKTVTNT